MATVVNISQSNRAAGTYDFVAPNAIPSDANAATFTLNISTAHKTSTGKTLTWEFQVSDDGTNWTLVSRGAWTSYGPGGLVLHDIDGPDVTNPNPRIGINLVPHRGKRIRGRLVLNQTTRVGVTIDVT